MKKIILALSILSCGFINGQDLPQPSPSSTISQKLGLTDVTIKYSRPSAKGRTIFGELVPFNEMWRTGANANTTIEFSTDANIGGKSVKAGTYSLFTIPTKGDWTIVLNSKTNMWGTGGYSKVNDVARFTVKAGTVDMVETFTIGFENLSSETADIVLSWEKTAVRIPLKVDVKSRALKNIKTAIAEAESDKIWRVYRNAANYYFNNKLDLNVALDYMNKSIEANNESWYSYWLKAEILAEKKMNKEAIASAKMAMKIGEAEAKEKGKSFDYGKMIQSGIDSWK